MRPPVAAIARKVNNSKSRSFHSSICSVLLLCVCYYYFFSSTIWNGAVSRFSTAKSASVSLMTSPHKHICVTHVETKGGGDATSVWKRILLPSPLVAADVVMVMVVVVWHAKNNETNPKCGRGASQSCFSFLSPKINCIPSTCVSEYGTLCGKHTRTHTHTAIKHTGISSSFHSCGTLY